MIHNEPNQTIFANGGLGLLQMVSEPDIKQCVSEGADPQGGWIVRSHVDWGEEQSISYKSVETSP